MRFSGSVLLALPLAVLATPTLVARQASTIESDISAIVSDIASLNTALNAFPDNGTPTGAQLAAVINAYNTLTAAVNKTTSDTNASPTLSSADSTTIYNTLSGTVYPKTNALLTNFINHEPAFANAGVTSVVKSDLQAEASDVNTLANALIAKSTGPATTKGKALAKKFAAAFAKAVKAYS